MNKKVFTRLKDNI